MKIMVMLTVEIPEEHMPAALALAKAKQKWEVREFVRDDIEFYIKDYLGAHKIPVQVYNSRH